MKSKVLIALLALAILTNCQSMKPMTGNSFSNAIAETMGLAYDEDTLSLVFMLLRYQEEENKWPLSVAELADTFGQDSVEQYLVNFKALEFLERQDTLYTNFELQADSANVIIGKMKFKNLSDSTFVNMNFVSSTGAEMSGNSYVKLGESELTDWRN